MTLDPASFAFGVLVTFALCLVVALLVVRVGDSR